MRNRKADDDSSAKTLNVELYSPITVGYRENQSQQSLSRFCLSWLWHSYFLERPKHLVTNCLNRFRLYILARRIFSFMKFLAENRERLTWKILIKQYLRSHQQIPILTSPLTQASSPLAPFSSPLTSFSTPRTQSSLALSPCSSSSAQPSSSLAQSSSPLTPLSSNLAPISPPKFSMQTDNKRKPLSCLGQPPVTTFFSFRENRVYQIDKNGKTRERDLRQPPQPADSAVVEGTILRELSRYEPDKPDEPVDHGKNICFDSGRQPR